MIWTCPFRSIYWKLSPQFRSIWRQGLMAGYETIRDLPYWMDTAVVVDVNSLLREWGPYQRMSVLVSLRLYQSFSSVRVYLFPKCTLFLGLLCYLLSGRCCFPVSLVGELSQVLQGRWLVFSSMQCILHFPEPSPNHHSLLLLLVCLTWLYMCKSSLQLPDPRS